MNCGAKVPAMPLTVELLRTCRTTDIGGGAGRGAEKFCDSVDTDTLLLLIAIGDDGRSAFDAGSAGGGGDWLPPTGGVDREEVFLWVEEPARRCCHGRTLLGGVDGELSPDMVVRGGS
jgi:hypothetical protein